MDGMLSRMLPGELDLIEAYDSIEPLGLEKLYRILCLGFSAVCNAVDGGGYTPEMFDPTAQQDEAETVVSPDAAAKTVTGWFGR